jgi:multidrug efflux pump subunit AcrB
MVNITRFFLTNFKFSIVLTIFALIFGMTGFFSINSETFPTVNIGSVVITTRYDGATAEESEIRFTSRL